MTDAKRRAIVKLLPDMSPERIEAALETVKFVEGKMNPVVLATLIRCVVLSWERVLKLGRLP